MKKVLIIEDEANIRKLIAYDVKQAGYEASEASNGLEAKDLVMKNKYDLILIDWMLPHMSGIELLKYFRAHNIQGVFMMLTAKDEEENILAAFEAGADDYVTKPFSPRVLIARINAYLNKQKKQVQTTFMDIEMDDNRRKVLVKGVDINVTKKEYELLGYFIMNANMVLSRDQILNDIWGFDYDGDTRIVDVHTFKLRNKLKDSEAHIGSNRGIGYILEAKNV